MEMAIDENYDIDRTADFIRGGNFTRIALQFPDELLKDSTRVVRALREKLFKGGDGKEVRLFIMADTKYGSCCVDEGGASHVDADCVIHYGHTCLSPTSTLPAFFVFGKASINVSNCVESLSSYALSSAKPVMVLFGLEYAHAIPYIREELVAALSKLSDSKSSIQVRFADVKCSVIYPPNYKNSSNGTNPSNDLGVAEGSKHSIGGLTWDLPYEHGMEDYLVLWIGSDNTAFTNIVLTFNGCEIVRYDAKENSLVTDLSQQRKILNNRYFLVELAKDADIVGILVGTLSSAGYLSMIDQLKDLIKGAGKKVYTIAAGRPNPAKILNFPEFDVLINVSCAQTALLDRKEYKVPIITPFEAILAFDRGSQWTGAYVMAFQDLMYSYPKGVRNISKEARFSFFKGGYVEDIDSGENGDEDNGVLALTNAAEKALQLRDSNSSLVKGTIKSAAYYFSQRTYRGHETRDNAKPEPYAIGRTGKASGYEHEKSKPDNSLSF